MNDLRKSKTWRKNEVDVGCILTHIKCDLRVRGERTFRKAMLLLISGGQIYAGIRNP